MVIISCVKFFDLSIFTFQCTRIVPAKTELASQSQSELTYPELAPTYQHTYMVPPRALGPTSAYQDPTIYHDQHPTIQVPAYHVQDPPVHVPNLHPRPGHNSYNMCNLFHC